MPQKSAHQRSIDPFYSFKCAIASFLANYAVGVFHPLELLKTRLQSHDGKPKDNLVPRYEGIVNGIRDIYAKEGLSGLFKGIHLTTFTSAIASALFFWIYQQRKLTYQNNNIEIMPATALASLEASILTTVLTQPFWVIKTRVLLNTAPNISQLQNIRIKSAEIMRHHGFTGFYLGLSMNLLLSLTGAIQMYTYEGSKIIYDKVIHTSLLGQRNFICGAISKLLSTGVTYPLTTIRTRAQQTQFITDNTKPKYKNSWDITKRIVKQQGVRGFFKGLVPNLFRGIPHRGVYFYFYQLLKKMLISDLKDQVSN